MWDETEAERLLVIREYFDFLVKECSFKGPFEYDVGPDHYYAYVRGQMIFNLGYGGGFAYYPHLVKTRYLVPELETGEKKLSEIDYGDRKSLDILLLVPNTQRIAFAKSRDRAAMLSFLADVIKHNRDILEGNRHKWSMISRVLRAIQWKLCKGPDSSVQAR